MASERTVQAFNEMKELYMSTMAPEILVEARQQLSPKQRRVMDVEPAGGDGDIDAKDLSKLRRFRDKLKSGEHNSEESAANVERNYKAISGVKESYSNWREENPELFEAVKETDEDKEIGVSNSVNNYKKGPNGTPAIKINPNAIEESFGDYDAEVISSEELDEMYLMEAAEIATEYFYENELNEHGVEELIESIGEQKFVDFVFDLVEDYELNEENLLEWRRGPDGTKIRGDQTTKSGKHFKDVKGGAKKTAARATAEAKSRKAEKESNTGESNRKEHLAHLSSREKALRANTTQKKVEQIKQNPQNTVKQNQPATKTKKGILDRVAGAILKGAERHQNAMKSARPAINQAARTAGTVAGTVAGAATALRRVGKKAEESEVAKKGRKVVGALGRGAWEGAGSYAKEQNVGKALGRAAGTVVKNLRKEELELQEKSDSQAQQQLFGSALSVKRGETPRSSVSEKVLDIVDSMSEAEIRKFAKTKHKGLPQHVKEETQLIDKVLRIVRESK